MNGVTDFIVAGPPGQTQAGPAGSFQAGPAGIAHIGEAGHVPIDTTPARIPYAAPTGGALHDTSPARIPYAPSQGGLFVESDTSGSIPLSGGGGGGGGGSVGVSAGGGGGGGSGWSSGIGGGSGGGGGAGSGGGGGGGWSSGIGGGGGGGGVLYTPTDTSASIPMSGGGGSTFNSGWSSGIGGGGSGGGGGIGGGSGGGGGGGPAVQHVIAPNTGGSSHFTPGGNVPIETGHGQFIAATGVVMPTPGYFHFTPSGSVPTINERGQFHANTGSAMSAPGGGGTPTPGGHVPIDTSSGGNFVPGGHVPMTPKVGIDPNMPHARINPPRPGRVYPHEMSHFHGERNVHVQNWPRDEWSHVMEKQSWQPSDTRSTWEPPKLKDFMFSTDLVDAGALMETTRTNVMEGMVQPRNVETHFDFGTTINQDKSTNIKNLDQSSLTLVDEKSLSTQFNENHFLDNSQSTARTVLQDFSADRVVNSDLDVIHVNNADVVNVSATDVSYTVANEPTYQFDMSRDVTLYFLMAPERSGGAIMEANG